AFWHGGGRRAIPKLDDVGAYVGAMLVDVGRVAASARAARQPRPVEAILGAAQHKYGRLGIVDHHRAVVAHSGRRDYDLKAVTVVERSGEHTGAGGGGGVPARKKEGPVGG